MENRENPSPQNSPYSNSGPQFLQTQQPLTPKPNLRSEASPYPTTFVQADASTFKHVVQMLTGSPETARSHRAPPPEPPCRGTIPPIRAAPPPRKQSFKLYERRSHAHHFKSSFVINTLSGGGAAQVLSPSVLDFPKLAIGSPVTPLSGDPFGRSSGGSEEERAIAEKGFYLHPSPRDGGEPRLLPLFPVTSPGAGN